MLWIDRGLTDLTTQAVKQEDSPVEDSHRQSEHIGIGAPSIDREEITKQNSIQG
jgi:hypothetical protein